MTTLRPFPGSGGGTSGRTIGDRLRRARLGALAGCALTTAPLVAAPAWAASTTYQRGQMAVNDGGKLYLSTGSAASAGTPTGISAASGGPTGTGPGVITDGTAGWVYLGPAVASDAGAPTLTSSSSPNANGTFTALTKYARVTPALTAPGLRYAGVLTGAAGFGAAAAGSTYPPIQNYKKLDGSMGANGGLVYFCTDAPKLAIQVGSTSTNPFNYRVRVNQGDGRGWRYVSQSAIAVPSGLGDPQHGTIIDWTATTGRRPRTYCIEPGPATGVGVNGVRVSALDTIWLPPAEDAIRLYWLSDSWGEGVASGVVGGGSQLPAMTIPWQVAQRLGVTDVVADVAGGTGYISTSSGVYNTYVTRSSHVAECAPDLCVVDEAIINDGSANAAAIGVAAAQTFANLRAGTSLSTPIIVFGAGITTTATQTSLAVGENAVAAAVAAMQAAGDKNIFFVSRITDAAGPWAFGTGKMSAPANDGNSDLFTTSDGAHRSDLGLDYEARRIADAIASSVLPLMA